MEVNKGGIGNVQYPLIADIDKSISRASEIVDKRPQAVISVVVVFTLLALGGASQISTSFSLDDFLSDDLEIMITADNIQSNFRGASYSQSQILIEGQVATPEFLDCLLYTSPSPRDRG